MPATAEQQIQMAAHGEKEKEERGARELPQRVPLTGDEDGAALSQRGRGLRTLIHSIESQMRPIYQPVHYIGIPSSAELASLPRICDPRGRLQIKPVASRGAGGRAPARARPEQGS